MDNKDNVAVEFNCAMKLTSRNIEIKSKQITSCQTMSLVAARTCTYTSLLRAIYLWEGNNVYV